MNAPARLDEFEILMPGLAPIEREKRALLRGYRNAATAMINTTDSDNARALAWMAIEYASGAMYAVGAAEALDDLNRLCKRLMLTAMLAEELDLARFAE